MKDSIGAHVTVLSMGPAQADAALREALAMGADAALIARPFVTAAYGAGVQGVSAYTAKTGGELRDTMAMCGVFAVKEITEEMLW